ncbi:MAG: M48 family metalloprotease [Alphaproteobacteria bacterium]
MSVSVAVLPPRWRRLAAAVGCALAVGLSGCQTAQQRAAPASEPPAYATESATADMLARYGGEYRNPALRAYVTAVGRRVLAQTTIDPASVDFVLLDTDVINALVIPGRRIFITRGMLTWLNSEAELAAVIAHEAAHLSENHSALQRQAARDAERRAMTQGLLGLDEDAMQALFRYSREQELEADRIGLRYLVAAGYPGAAAVSSHEQFLADSRLGRLLRGFPGEDTSTPGLLDSHPASDDRIATLTAMDEFRAGGDDRRVAYQEAIEGVPFGLNADDWRVVGDRVIQPRAGIGFDRPAGYALAASGGVLSGSGPGEGILSIDFVARDPSTTPAAFLNRNFARFDTEPSATQTMGGYPGAEMAFSFAEDGRDWYLIVATVGLRENALMRVLAYGPATGQPAVRQAFEAVIGGLRDIGAVGDSASQRIAVVAVQRGETAASLARRMNMGDMPADFAEDLLRAINGLDDDAQLTAGQRIKLIL